MHASRLNAILDSLPSLRLGVIGDFCVDAYWLIDPSASEVSLETGLPTRPVRRQQYTLGGAGNVVANLLSLGVGKVSVFGVIGGDPFGSRLKRLLEEHGADTAALLLQTADWDTPVYIKPVCEKREENRIDFSNFNALLDETARDLLARLEAELPALDGVIINQQLPRGLHTPFVQAGLNRLIAHWPDRLFIVDSRHFPERYTGCLHKLNAREAARLCGLSCAPGEAISQEAGERLASELFRRWRKPVIVTNGPRGCLAADAAGIHAVPGRHIPGPTDPVGAGDSLLAGAAAVLAGGGTAEEAAAFGNLVAGVTVQKLGQTGTASPAEIRAFQ